MIDGVQGFPTYVDLEFTARCNLQCGFCFGPPILGGREKDLLPEFWERVIGEVARRGARGIVVSGGEPTLYAPLRTLLEFAKSLDLQTVLSTHGRFADRVLSVAMHCDWIALPVDGRDVETVRRMRGDDWGIDAATSLAARLRAATAGRVQIKLGSVATASNGESLVRLAERLTEIHDLPFQTWKLYQYTPRRKFAHRADEFNVTDHDFAALEAAIVATGIVDRLHTVFSSHASRRRAYLFVYPDGTVAIPNEGTQFGDIVLGNCAREGDIVFDRVSRHELFANCANFERTYGAS